jgi:CHAT domain-containing protein
VVVPHGVLALVPFAALPAPAPTRRPAGGAPPNGVPPDGAPPDGAPPNGAPARGEPLGVRYALRYAPSLAVLAALDPAPAGAPGDAVAAAAGPPAALAGRAALVVGDPAMPGDPDADGDPFAPLPEAGRTADWLGAWLRARPLTGARATREAVLGALGDAALVHLGTHGRAYAGERVRESFVALAPGGARGGGLLRVADLLAAPPLRAELVALTACQTGLGDVTDAEGTVGFQRALLARGARGALLTLWQVPAAESDTLVRRFYRHWLGAGVSKGEALRRAQAELRADRLRLARGDEAGDAANPYYWAGFQLVGGR